MPSKPDGKVRMTTKDAFVMPVLPNALKVDPLVAGFLHMVAFLELSGYDTIDPDWAVEAMEHVGHYLDHLPPKSKSDLAAQVARVAEYAQKQDWDGSAVQFLDNFMESFGIECEGGAKAEKQHFSMGSLPPSRRRIAAEYLKLTRALSDKKIGAWALVSEKVPKYKKQRDAEFAEFFTLSNCFPQKVSCHLTYQLPWTWDGAPDHPSSDDSFDVTMTPNRSTYRDFVTSFVPAAIEAFKPYVATLGPDALLHIDWDEARKVNGRKNVFRLYPVHYLADKLIHSAFKMPAAKFQTRMKPFYESVKEFHHGVLLANPKPLTVEQCNHLSKKAMDALS